MVHQFTIGALAREVGLPVSTLRYYERQRLVLPLDRTAGNYRLYGEDALTRLRFIRAAQAAGLALEDVATLLAAGGGGLASCREVQALIADRLGAVEQRLRDLSAVRKVMRSLLAACQAAEPDSTCPAIDRIEGAAAVATLAGPRRTGRRARRWRA